MRATWVVLGVVVAVGAVAYVKLRSQCGESGPALAAQRPVPPSPPGLIPAPEATKPGDVAPAASAPQTPEEERARTLVASLIEAHGARQPERVAQLEAALRSEAWDTVAARRYAVQAGFQQVKQAGALSGLARIQALDRARRLLSRGVWLEELFDADGGSTPDRERLLESIRGLNQQVMTWKPALEGVTRSYVVPSGKAPVQIVSDEKLRMGHNALLLWNKRGNLDPRRLVAGETLLLPTGEIWLDVSLAKRRLVVWLDDVWVREFRVGVGKPETPTPPGTWHVVKKQENPPWYPSTGGIIPAGDPRNELGAVWIHIATASHPDGYGIHGTNSPETVGSECSQGCVRLSNEQAQEIFWWVRQPTNGGQATRVEIR